MDKKSYIKEVLRPLSEHLRLGSKVNEVGTQLIGHVPHVAPKAYFHVIYAPLKDEELKALETNLDRSLPIQFKHFLSFANGLDIYSGYLSVLGFVPHKRKAEVHPHNYPGNILVSNVQGRIRGLKHNSVIVGFYKFDGSYVCVEESGKVFRFDANGDGKTIQEWPSFDTWIIFEIKYLRKCFDEAGKLKGDIEKVFGRKRAQKVV